MEKQPVPKGAIIGAVVAAVAVLAVLAWFFLFRPATPVVNTPPPDFIDPATGLPKGMGTGGAGTGGSSPPGGLRGSSPAGAPGGPGSPPGPPGR